MQTTANSLKKNKSRDFIWTDRYEGKITALLASHSALAVFLPFQLHESKYNTIKTNGNNNFQTITQFDVFI